MLVSSSDFLRPALCCLSLFLNERSFLRDNRSREAVLPPFSILSALSSTETDRILCVVTDRVCVCMLLLLKL